MARALAGLIMCLAVCTVHAGEKPAKAALRGSKGMVKMQNPFTGRMVRVPRNVAEDVKKQMNEVNALASVAQVQDLAAKATAPAPAPAAPHFSPKPAPPTHKHVKAKGGHSHTSSFDEELSEETAGLEQLQALASRTSGGGSEAAGVTAQIAGLLPSLSAGAGKLAGQGHHGA